MITTAGTVLVSAALFCVGALALASGAHPISVASLVAGIGMLLLRVNAILDRGRLRRGKPESLTVSLTDLSALTRRDWAELAIVTVVGAVLFIGGAATASSGA